MTVPMVMIVVVMVVVACMVMITVLPYGIRHWDRFETRLANRIERLRNGLGRRVYGQCSCAQLEAQATQTWQLGQGVTDLTLLGGTVHGGDAEHWDAFGDPINMFHRN